MSFKIWLTLLPATVLEKDSIRETACVARQFAAPCCVKINCYRTDIVASEIPVTESL